MLHKLTFGIILVSLWTTVLATFAGLLLGGAFTAGLYWFFWRKLIKPSKALSPHLHTTEGLANNEEPSSTQSISVAENSNPQTLSATEKDSPKHLPDREEPGTPEEHDGEKASATGDDMKDNSKASCIMVVDDNENARLFLQQSLGSEYKVILAADGSEALRQLDTHNDVKLVVSDVMMPVMDGIELVRHMRKDRRYSHIPVILLTAMDGEENIVAGLEEGVADYLTKPYSMAVLRLRIRKILEYGQNARKAMDVGVEIEPSAVTVSSLDEDLIRRVIANIEANIDDASYSVVQLSSAVGMTRGHLYKKLMAITGKSPLEFIRIVKMKRGKSLIEQGKTNISEVADMVGFSSKQFAVYFKKMYGDNPSEHLRKHRNQPAQTNHTKT